MEKTKEIETQETNPDQIFTSNVEEEKPLHSKTTPIEEQIPIDPHKEFNIQKDYINMNSVEQEKLAWMKDVPKIELSKVF